MAKDYILEKRKFVIGGIAISIVLIYLIRLFVLQITTDDYKKNADSNAFLNKIQYPSRGAIYDRTGKLLVFNQPAYDITIVPKEIENLDTLDLCQSLNITRAQFLKIMSDMKDRRRKRTPSLRPESLLLDSSCLRQSHSTSCQTTARCFCC